MIKQLFSVAGNMKLENYYLGKPIAKMLAIHEIIQRIPGTMKKKKGKFKMMILYSDSIGFRIKIYQTSNFKSYVDPVCAMSLLQFHLLFKLLCCTMGQPGHKEKQNLDLFLQGAVLYHTKPDIQVFVNGRQTVTLLLLFLQECVPHFSLARKLEHRLQGHVSQFEMHHYHKSSLRPSAHCTGVLCHIFLIETSFNSYFRNVFTHQLHATVLSDQKYVQIYYTYYYKCFISHQCIVCPFDVCMMYVEFVCL